MDGVMVTAATTSQSRNDSVDAVISIFLPLVVHGLIRNVDRLYNLCISLARGIDAAIANNEVPSRASELPLLVKQVCKSINPMLQAAIMVLMFSVKYACKNRWFSDEDAHGLLILAAELEKSFPSTRNRNTDARHFRPTISTIMSRFLPRMKMGDILGFVVVKPGYNTYAIDFIVSNYENSSCEDKIYLFVAKTDDVETSECLKSPPNVNFLLNGYGVEERNNVSVNVGPQIPTDVTDMLTFGPNLLQLVGQFNGNYIIAFAYISISSSIRPTLKDYVPPRIAALNSASEAIEFTSWISLNCPLSLSRIKTPVKGRQCRHVQCFDFDSFMDINSIRPSWRCPYCNQYVCFTDICIDQTMVKILNEIGSSFTRVKISVDGSYKAVTETNDHTHKRRRKDPPMLPRTNLNTSINVGPSSASQISLPLQSSPLWVPQMLSSSLQHHVGPRPRTGLYTPVHGEAASASRVSHDLLWDSVQMPSSSRQHVGLQPRTDLDTVILGGPSSAYISSALPLVPLQVPQMLSSLQQLVGSQNWGHNDNSVTSQRLGNLQPPAQLPIAPRVSSAHNIRRPPITFQSPIRVHLSSHSLPSVLENADASRASLRFRRSNDTLEPSQAEQNWRPTGLMRGSLTGPAYSEALAQFLNPGPSHPADRSLLGAVEHPPGFSPQMQSPLANDRNWHAPQGGTDPWTEPGSMAGSSGSKPEPSFR